MISLITGASSGIGKDMAFEFADRGYDLILVARIFDRLKEVKNEIIEKYDKCNVLIMKCDVSNVESVKNLYNDIQKEFGNIDVLVNNAGFGDCGKFYETDLEKDISMINTNILGLHVLTKLFLQDMVKVNKGYILNIASIAGFMPGPLMATYYSTKAYVVRLTRAIAKELKVVKEEKVEKRQKDNASRLNARRKIMTKVNKVKDENGNSIDLADKLFNVLGPRYEKRTGGYTQIIKLGQRRGDGAETVILKVV